MWEEATHVLPEPGLVPLVAAGATIRFHTRAIPAGTPLKNSTDTIMRSSLTQFLAFLNTAAVTDECNGKGHHLVLLTDPRFSYQVPLTAYQGTCFAFHEGKGDQRAGVQVSLENDYVGYVTVGFLVVQTILGLCTYFKRKVEGQRIPAFPDRIHCTTTLIHLYLYLFLNEFIFSHVHAAGALNWLTLILAYTTIFTGLWVMVLPWYFFPSFFDILNIYLY